MNNMPTFARGISKSSRAMFPIPSDIYKFRDEISKGKIVYYMIYYMPFLSSEIKRDVCKEPRDLEKKVIKHYKNGDLILVVDIEMF